MKAAVLHADFFDRRVFVLRFQGLLQGNLRNSLLAKVHEDYVHRQAVQPGRECGFATERTNLAIELQKCFLGEILRLGIVTGHPQAKGEYTPLMARIQRFEGGHIARLCLGNNLSFCGASKNDGLPAETILRLCQECGRLRQRCRTFPEQLCLGQGFPFSVWGINTQSMMPRRSRMLCSTIFMFARSTRSKILPEGVHFCTDSSSFAVHTE